MKQPDLKDTPYRSGKVYVMQPRIIGHVFLLLAVLLVASINNSTAQQVQASFDPELAVSLQTVINQERALQRLRGVSAAVYIPGEGIWQGVNGLSGNTASEAITKDMRFAVASITKTFISALILALTEENRLSLKDSLHQWLPATQYISPNITIEQLLNHKSGIYNFTNNSAFWEALWLEPQRIWMPEEILESFLAPPVFEPGGKFEYSNTNFILLGMVVERVTGETVASQLRDRFFDSFGLNDTFFASEEEVTGVVANNWSDTNSDGLFENLSDMTGASLYSMVWTAGGISSTAADMVRWAEALYHGEVLEAVELAQMLEFTAIDSDSPWKGYGLGTMKFEFEGQEMWGHTGLLPGYRSILAYAPATGISICVLINQDDLASVYTITPLLLNAVTRFRSTAISQEEKIPEGFVLRKSYPNPFHHSVTLDFDVVTPAHITIDIYDTYGRHAVTLVDRYYEVGNHQVQWNAAAFSSGLYFYRFTAGVFSATGSMLGLK